MFLKNLLKLKNTLAFRLSLWYAMIFIISSVVAFFLFYLVTSNIIQKRFDEDLLEEIEKFSEIYAKNGMEEVEHTLALEGGFEKMDKEFFRILTPEGNVDVSTDMSYWKDLGPVTNALQKINSGKDYVYEILSSPEREYEVRIIYGIIGAGKILQIGESIEEEAQFLKILRDVFLSTIGFIMILAGVVGWFMARRAMKGVEEVTQTALDISTSGTLQKRVPVKTRGDEIERLAITFNGMLDRIHTLVTGIRQMADDIAHDLKSLITRIRGVAEVTLTNAKSTEEYITMTAEIIEQCDKMFEILNTMMFISETEAGAEKLKREEVDVAEVIRNACELFEPVAEKKEISLTFNIPDTLLIQADIQSIQRMMSNLIDNALKYTPTQGTVNVSADRDNGQVVITVKDDGAGISEDDLPHIFKRFYRCDKSRSQEGVGLGLSLVKAIVQSHQGEVIVTSKQNVGSTFKVTLPEALPSS
ncbi:MAG: ATP-binding protein [bacterium]|nr:ATP-binding protein [bacterium]